MVNFRRSFTIVSRNMFIMVASLLLCGILSLVFSENALPFIYTAAIALAIGSTLYYLSRKQAGTEGLHKKDAYFIVTFSWVIMSLIGSLPYVFSGAIPSFMDAWFEAVSGFTTTGSSILSDIESLPRSILFWRSLTHWIGGIGIIVLVILIMPTLKIGGYHLFSMESSLQERMRAGIRAVGIRLMWIYISLTVIEVVLLLLGKMNLFESVCHAFGTVATGGFSPKNTSIGGYSPYIQYVVMVFMLLSGVNFGVHYFLLKRKFRKVERNEELRFYLFIVFALGAFIASQLHFKMDQPLEESVRESFFQVISIVTCTGYATADYLAWPEYLWLLLFFAMFLGGSSGSTAGGIKIVRHVILFKMVRLNLRHMVSPHAVIPLRLNGKTITYESGSAVLSFIVIYLSIFLIGTLVLLVMGIDAETASSSVATCMAGIGPGIGSVGPAGNFSHLPDLAKLTLSFLMILGRLEIYTVLVLFTRNFWSV